MEPTQTYPALEALRLQLEWGADEALDEAPVDRTRPAPPAEATQAAARPPPAGAVTPPRPPPAPGPAAAARAEAVAAACATVRELRDALAAFTDCPLAATATNLVFADGNPQAGLVFVGEAPGEAEDLSGRPFAGPDGQRLDRMLASIGLDRTRALLTTLIPWRPPGNRAPTEAERLVCLPFLLRHLTLLRPRIVVTLGRLPAEALTGSRAGLHRLRGTWRELALPGAPPARLLPMLHPAALTQNPERKKDAWTDLLRLREALDQQTPH